MAEMIDIEELREKVIGKNDDQIHAAVESFGGIDALLDQVFRGMQEAFDPQRARSQRGISQFDIDALEGLRSYQIKVADGRCEVAKGTPETPRVTLTLSLPNFLRLVTGNLNGLQAFMSGQIKLTGDVMFSQSIQGWFRQP